MKIVQFTIPVSAEESIVVQEEIAANFYQHLHRHTEIQITWILKGTGTLIVSGNMTEFADGDIYIFGSNQEHVFKGSIADKSTDHIHAISIFFHPEANLKGLFLLPEMKKAQKFLATIQGGCRLKSGSAPLVISQIEQTKHSQGINRIASFMELLNTLIHAQGIEILSADHLETRLSENEGLRMNDVYQYTLHHYQTEISIGTIAGVAHMTPEAFCRYFKKHTRKTYHAFLNEIRIHEACRLLAQNQAMSSAEIAYTVGFVSSVSFNRVFKKVKHATPLAYQKAYLEAENK